MPIEKNADAGGSKKKKMKVTTAGLGFNNPGTLKKEYAAYMQKTAGSSDVVRTPIQFLDVARFDPILFFIQHRDRKELNFRLRYYYEFHPLVNNAITLHATFPISDFTLECRESKHKQIYNDLKDSIGLQQLLIDIGKDYWLLGESFINGRWDDSKKLWQSFTMFPPENVIMRATYVTPKPLMFLEVDDGLKKLVNSHDKIDQQLVTLIDPIIVEKVKNGSNIQLEDWCTTHFANKTSRYDLRGTSICKSILKDVMYEDKLRLLQFTFADRFMFPLKIFKLGNPQTGWVPGRKHFEALRDLLVSAQNDPDFNIIFHHGLQVEYLGVHDKIQNLIPEFEFVENRILTGLFTNKSLTHAEGPTYSNASVAMRVLMHRYMVIRDLLSTFMREKIFRKVAEARGWYISDTTGETGEEQIRIAGKYKVLDLPKPKWRKLNLLDNTQQQQFLINLHKERKIDHNTIMEMFDLETESIVKHLKEEEGSVVDPAYIKARDSKVNSPEVAQQILQGKKGDQLDLSVVEVKGKDKVKGVTPAETEDLGDIAPEMPPSPGEKELKK